MLHFTAIRPITLSEKAPYMAWPKLEWTVSGKEKGGEQVLPFLPERLPGNLPSTCERRAMCAFLAGSSRGEKAACT